jgi:tRNA pseudouridine55 synthase
MTDGILLIDKPAGISSFGVVSRIRRVLSERAGKKIKVGHTGTLDPFATGLMIIVIGKECKNASNYSKLDKTYEATVCLGSTSSTGDPEGDIAQISDMQPSLNEIKRIIEQFIGDEIEQIPPMFSAIKIDGQRAYKLAREGKKIDMPVRKITIYSLEIVNYSYPELKIKTRVSSGTYIRTLAVDIGENLGIGAYCSQLRRANIANWSVNEAKQLSDLGIND